ncbi:unnamed protein product, partial [Aphanomyces euteiches]
MRLFASLSFATCAVVALNGPRQGSPVSLANLRALKVDSFDTPSRQLAGNEGGRHMGRSEIKGRKIGGQAGSVAGAVAGGTIGGTG